MMRADQSPEEAFTAMVRRHEALIYKVCLTFTHQRKNEVQDLKQEVLCNMWRGFERYEHRHQESTWVYKVALNTGLQYYRRQNRQPPTIPIDEQMAERYANPEDQELLKQLYDMVHQLDEEEQKLIYLYLDDLKGEEMAKVVGTSAGNVRVRLHRIKDKLKKMAQHE